MNPDLASAAWAKCRLACRFIHSFPCATCLHQAAADRIEAQEAINAK